MNQYNALVGYDLSIDGVKESDAKFLYFQCPISRHTYIDRSVPYYEVIDGKTILAGSSVELDTLKREYVAQGYYMFLSSSKNEKFALGASFPMASKMNPSPDIELMCVQIANVHLKHLQSELNRDAILKRLGLSE